MVALLFKKQRASIGTVQLDASVSETHEARVEVTEHPVEQGVNISDHARPLPRALKIEGLVSNYALPDPTAPLTARLSGSTQYSSRSELAGNRAEEAYSELLRLKDAAELITVVTAIQTYENMLITDLNIPRDASSGDGLRFSVNLKQVTVVNSRTVDQPVSEDKPKKKRSVGNVNSKTTPAPTEDQSLLRELGASKFLGLQ